MSKELDNQEKETNNLLDPFGILSTMREASEQSWQAWRDASMQAWSKMMIDFVNSEAYSEASARWLDTYLTISQPFQRVIETTTTQVLTRMNMPVRTDIISLAERLTNVEMRLDDLDAKIDEILRAIRSLSSSQQQTNTPSSSRAKGTHARARTKEAH